MKIISVVGARPNFMKIAPFSKAIEAYNLKLKNGSEKIHHILVHTGQHYDERMNGSFFTALRIPSPDINLGIGSGSHAEQVGKTMIEFEKVLQKERPDWVVVVGDVNATLACSITAKKLHIKCCHIEAGLRSEDMNMPEEINRLVTDVLCDLLLTPDHISSENLSKEGKDDDRIKFVGNIMIDTLDANRGKAEKLDLEQIVQQNLIEEKKSSSDYFHQDDKKFVLITMHRPSNVDEESVLGGLVDFLVEEVTAELPIIWPIHPRTTKMLKNFELWDKILASNKIIPLHPIGYHEMLKLNIMASIVLTDSGGLQEECSVLGTPCLTLRWNTERPITLQENGGASILVGNNIERIRSEFYKMISQSKEPSRPLFWDGNTAQRCLQAILNFK
jgi:UDP-N-acetylglucosamine 2-epimerase (non-hydrolysing)